MKGRVKVEELVERIHISRSTLLRLRTEERKQYDLDQIVAICVGLHLPPSLSENFIVGTALVKPFVTVLLISSSEKFLSVTFIVNFAEPL